VARLALLVPVARHRFRPAGPPATEPERRAYEAGKQAAKSEGASCPSPNLSRSERRAFARGLQAGRDPDDLRAPLAWPLGLCFLLPQPVLMARADKAGRFKGQAIAAVRVFAAEVLSGKVKDNLERRRALQIGLTPETTPQVDPASCVDGVLSAVAVQLFIRIRGYKFREPPWPRALAMAIILEFERRRAWNRALRAATPDLAETGSPGRSA
jgi:hypothetical protein